MVVVSLVDASFGVLMGWLSSRIGEGLIYDLRTKVFAHVQRMSLAFFTRTQTGALVSRLNNDVIGAQRAFTSVLSSVVSNSISVVVVGVAMFYLSWQVTLLCLATFPIPDPGLALGGSPAGRTQPRPDERQRRPRQHDDRALQRGRCAAAQAVRAPRRGRTRGTARRRPSSATSASASP
jgi:ABC-type multidrug transport system fused ATPase/permease subunit